MLKASSEALGFVFVLRQQTQISCLIVQGLIGSYEGIDP